MTLKTSCKFNFIDLFSSINLCPNSLAKKKEKRKKIYLEFLDQIYLQSEKQLTEIFRTCQENEKLNVVF